MELEDGNSDSNSAWGWDLSEECLPWIPTFKHLLPGGGAICKVKKLLGDGPLLDKTQLALRIHGLDHF